jgi:hypothetical protein
MTFTKLISYVSVITLLAGTAAFGGSTELADAELSIHPSSTLPFLPAAMVITVPREIVDAGLDSVPASLEVRNVGTGDTFTAFWDREGLTNGYIQTSYSVNAPGGRIKLLVPLRAPHGSEWFADGRLSIPGTYALRVRVRATELGLAKDLWSNEAILKVIVPTGVDAEAYAWLKAKGNGQWTRRDWIFNPVAADLIKHFPGSTYAAFSCTRFTADNLRSREALKTAIADVKIDWLREYYEVLLLIDRLGLVPECDHLTGREAGECQLNEFARVRTELLRLSRDAKSEGVRLLAAATASRLTPRDPMH